MYPEITPLIRDAIKRRYELIPYLYSCALESHLTATPPQRWVGWGYEADPEVWTPALLRGETQYWLGDTLLIGGVYEPGLTTGRMYLPSANKSSDTSGSTSNRSGHQEGYINLNAPYQHIPAGQWVDIASSWHTSIPVLAKIGGAIPIGKSVPTSSPLDDPAEFSSLVPDDYRGIEIFPPKGSSTGHVWRNTWYEDDGVSAKPIISRFVVCYSSTEEEVMVGFQKEVGEGKGGFVPLWWEVSVILPVGDERVVLLEDGTKAINTGKDGRGRKVFKIAV